MRKINPDFVPRTKNDVAKERPKILDNIYAFENPRFRNPNGNGSGLMFAGIKTTEPVFTVSEVARIFFARQAHWIRDSERKGWITYEGKPIGMRRPNRSPGQGDRVYTLADVEKMVHSLIMWKRVEYWDEHEKCHRFGYRQFISVAQARDALTVLRDIGEVYGYFPGS